MMRQHYLREPLGNMLNDTDKMVPLLELYFRIIITLIWSYCVTQTHFTCLFTHLSYHVLGSQEGKRRAALMSHPDHILFGNKDCKHLCMFFTLLVTYVGS